MKNEHLVPQVIIDLVNHMNSDNTPYNTKVNYQMRIEAIRDYCNTVLDVNKQQPITFYKKKTRK